MLNLVIKILLITILFTSCKNSKSKNIAKKEEKDVIINFLRQCPIITDTLLLKQEFFKLVSKNYDTSELMKYEGSEFTKFESMAIQGAKKKIFLIEYDWKDGAMSQYPWKIQALIDNEGNLIKLLSAVNFELLKTKDTMQNLIKCSYSSAKSVGYHEIYNFNNDTLNLLFDGSQAITIDGYAQPKYFEPEELELTINYDDKNEFSDLSFKGKEIDGSSMHKKDITIIAIYDSKIRKFKLK